MDARTPETYFRSSEQRRQEGLTHIRERLDDLLLRLRALNAERTTTPAQDVVEASISASPQKFVKSIEHALEYKIFCRVEPYMVDAGDEIETQLFSDD